MATAVQIELMVDEKGAVSGVRNFDTAVKGSAGNVRVLNQELGNVGVKGAAGTAAASRGLKEMSGHALTSLDNVRLLRDDFGIHIPRAMEKAIASSKVLSGAIKGIGAGLIAFGAIEIGAHVFTSLIEGAHKLWEEHLSLTKAAQDYNAEIAKAAHDDFGNTRSIETTIARINEAADAVKRYHEASDAANQKMPVTWRRAADFAAPGLGTEWDAYHQRSVAHDLQGQSVDAQKQVDELKRKQAPEQIHQGKLLDIEAQHAGDGRLRGEQKITAEKQKQRALDLENMRFDASREGMYANYARDSNLTPTKGSKEQIAREKQDADLANVVAPNAGGMTYGFKMSIADAKADAELFNLRREQGQELEHLREQALEASLRGVALYKAQEAAAIEELKFKDIDSVAARKYVHDRFHAEELRRLEDERRATDEIVEQTKIASLTGIARVQGEGQSRIDKTNADPNLSDEEKKRRVAAYQSAMIEEVGQKQLDWSQRVDQVIASSQSKQVSGFKRISAEAAKASADLQREFDEAHNKMDLTKPGAQAALDADMTKLGAGMTAIGTGADRESADLARKNAEETEQIEAQARSKFLTAEKQKTAAIQTEYNQRLLKLREELNAEEISENDYNRRVAAAAQERDAEMIEAATAARQKMAEQFTQLFEGLNHPMKMLEKLGDKVAGEAAASLVQRLQQHGHGGGDQPRQSTGVGVLDDVLGGFGIKRPKGVGAGGDRNAEVTGTRGQAAEKVFSVSQATIHIGSASIVGGVSGGGGSSIAGTAGGSSWSAPGASTGLTASGSSGVSGGIGGAPSSTSAPDYGGSGTIGGVTGFGAPEASGGAGGAGDSGGVTQPGNFAAGSGGPVPQRTSFLGGMTNNISQGVGLFKQGAQIFGGGGGSGSGGSSGDGGGSDSNGSQPGSTPGNPFSSGNAGDGSTGNGSQPGSTPGNPFSSSGQTNGGMLGGGGIGANAGGAIGGALGMYSAVEGTGGVGGAMKGAMSGMELGMALGGPVGAAIGLAAGAVIGAIGFGGREQARVYDLKTVRPKLLSDQDAYAQGGMSYTDAYSDAQQMIGTSWKTTKAMGPAAESYWGDTIKPELLDAMGKFTAEEKAGRSMYSAQSQSFGSGTDNVEATGMNLNHANERIFSPVENSDIIKAVNGSGGGTAQAQPSNSGWSGDLHVHAIDAAGVAQFFDQHKHLMRGSLNQSYAENSGGGL